MIKFSPSGRYLAMGNMMGDVFLYQIENKKYYEKNNNEGKLKL